MLIVRHSLRGGQVARIGCGVCIETGWQSYLKHLCDDEGVGFVDNGRGACEQGSPLRGAWVEGASLGHANGCTRG